MKRKKKGRESNIDRILEIPREVSTGEPRIINMGFNKILIENYTMIMEYQDFFIRIATEIGIININGFNLKINEMTTNELYITGKIESVDLESRE